MYYISPMKKLFRKFAFKSGGVHRDEAGVAAVEFAIIMPVLVLMLSGIIQFGMLMFVQNQMINVARETSRRIAVGELTTAAAQQYARDSLAFTSANFAIAITAPNPAGPNPKDVTVDIRVPISQVSLVDILGLFQNGKLRASVTMRQEQNPA